MSLEAKQRMEDAYMNFVGSVTQFDKIYREELKYVERYLRGGWTHRVRAWATRKLPESEQEILTQSRKANP